jgi:hypothetical protein
MAECIAAAETEIHRCRVTSQKIVEDARRLYGARAKGYYQEAAKALEAELASQTSMRDQLQQKTAHVRGLLNSSVSAILPSEKPGRYAGFTVPTGHKTQQAAIRGPSSHMAPAGMDALLDADVRRGRRTDGMTPSPTIGRTLR